MSPEFFLIFRGSYCPVFSLLLSVEAAAFNNYNGPIISMGLSQYFDINKSNHESSSWAVALSRGAHTSLCLISGYSEQLPWKLLGACPPLPPRLVVIILRNDTAVMEYVQLFHKLRLCDCSVHSSRLQTYRISSISLQRVVKKEK